MSFQIDAELQARICRAYIENPLPSRTMAPMFGVSPCCISKTLRRNNVPLHRKQRREVDETTARLICERYLAGASAISLSVELDELPQTIRRALVRGGVAIRGMGKDRGGHTVREDAFDVLTDEGAYWIGFLMADGCITQRVMKTGYVTRGIKLSLKEADIDHVRAFLSFLSATHNVTIARKVEKKTGRVFPSAVASFQSNHMADTLALYGVVPNKTHDARVNLLEMNRDFWRGVIDGDGCIHIRKDGAPLLSIAGSRLLLEQFRSFVLAHVPDCRFAIHQDKRHADTIGTFNLSHTVAARILEVLYRDCKTSLPRKKALAESIISDPDMFRDKRRNRDWVDRSGLTLDGLMARFAEMGIWAAVAKEYGMRPNDFCRLKRNLIRKSAQYSPPRSPS